jgi:ribosome-associated protein
MDIPENEFDITFARSSGPGGQNVNKTSTKAVLHWSIGKSKILSAAEKTKIRVKFSNKINNNDELVLKSEEERSQLQNRESVIRRLQEMVAQALLVKKKRFATRPTRASKLKRIENKKQRSQIKAERRFVKD